MRDQRGGVGLDEAFDDHGGDGGADLGEPGAGGVLVGDEVVEAFFLVGGDGAGGRSGVGGGGEGEGGEGEGVEECGAGGVGQHEEVPFERVCIALYVAMMVGIFPRYGFIESRERKRPRFWSEAF